MLERTIEKNACAKAKAAGWWVRKFVAPGNRGVPDRLFIKGGRVVFIEFKRPGGTTTALQETTIRQMRYYGAEVYVCDSVDTALAALA